MKMSRVTENEYRKSHNTEHLLEAQATLNISGLLSKYYFIILYSPQLLGMGQKSFRTPRKFCKGFSIY